MSFRTFNSLCLIVMSLFVSHTSIANDSAITWGGSPVMLRGHQTVEMRSERITIVVNKSKVRTECRFVFVNHGAACKVRMGFPSVGVGAWDPDEEIDDVKELRKTPPKPVFKSFIAYANGRRIPTKLVRGKDPHDVWYAKVVSFPANSTVNVKDVYTEKLGSEIANSKNDSLHNLHYILHTGSSWRGNLGTTEISVRINYPKLRTPLKLISLKPFHKNTNNEGRDAVYNASMKHRPNFHTIYYDGPSKPSVHGKTLYFVKRNYKPTIKDDLDIFFKWDQSME